MTDKLSPPAAAPTFTPLRRGARAAAQGGAVFESLLTGPAEEPAGRDEVRAASGVNPMLLHELALDTATQRDRDARRRGNEALELLAELQRALLHPGDGAGHLARLTELADHFPQAADPGLAEVGRAIGLRVAIELARRQATPQPLGRAQD